jgi:phosphoglycolate phosphatase-like HAD superfamily hydrolase
MARAIKAVFFDFDGTISDAKVIILDSFSRTFDELGFEYDNKKLMDLIGVKMEKILVGLGLEEKYVDKVRKKFYRYLIKNVSAGGISPCVSLKPLWKMKDEGFPLFVVSNGKGSFLRASIKELKIGDLFKEVYGADKFGSKDECLRSFFKKMNIHPSEAVYVGDRFSDIEFARKAGCVSVAIHNKCSWSTLKKIKAEKPDYIVRDFYGLRKVLLELNKG